MSDTPSDDELTTENDEHNVSFHTTVADNDKDFLQDDTKLVVSWMQMKELFQHCFRCGTQAEIIKV